MKILSFFFLITINIFAADLAITQCDHRPQIKSQKDKVFKKTSALKLKHSPHALKQGHLSSYQHKTSYDKSEIQDILKDYQIGLKLLIISASLDPEEDGATLDFVKSTLLSRGIPYDVLLLSQDGIAKTFDLNSILINKNGDPKYYGIVTTSGELYYKTSKNKMISALNESEWIQLQTYEKKYAVRRVSMFSYPHSYLGVKDIDIKNHTKHVYLSPHTNLKKIDPALKTSSKFLLQFSWYYFGEILNPSQSRAILHYNRNSLKKEKSVAGVITSFPDEREQMHFFFSQSIWNRGSQIAAESWVNWVTKGQYIGKRRMYLIPQVDDFFLTTDLWVPEKKGEIPGYLHRLSSTELDFFIQWQKQFREKINNPQFKTELAFNGKGALDRIQDTIKKEDLLYNTSKTNIFEFNWVSHTFSHADLNFITYKDAIEEYQKNLSFFTDFQKIAPKHFSRSSLVPPRISGLFNPQALEAMEQLKINYVVGDNSRTKLRPKHPYTARKTTKAFNGYDGILIIPRHATEIYYNTSNVQELVSEYNHLYQVELKKESSFEDIYEREVDRVSNQLFTYDYAPHMFHQSNMSVFEYKGKKMSLLSKWLDDITDHVQSITDLPLLNVKMDQLAQLYLDRIDFNRCDFELFLTYVDGFASKITGTSKKKCIIPITTILKIKNDSSSYKKEIYGPDTTYYIKNNAQQSFEIPISQ